MKKIPRITLWAIATLAVLVLGLLLYLRNADLGVYKDHIEAFLSRKIGHELHIDGAFELHFGSHTSLIADEISLANPDWPPAAEIVQAGHLAVTVELWSLLSGLVIVEALEVRDVRIRLQRNAEAAANWKSGNKVEESGESGGFDPTRIVFKDVRIAGIDFQFDDALRERPIRVALERLTILPDRDKILDLDLSAVVGDIPVRADGKLGPWDHLITGRDVTADLDLTLGRTRLGIEGSVADLRALEGVELTLDLDGPDIERVIGVFGLPPFAAGQFHVAGRVDREDNGSRFRVEGNLGDIQLLANGFTESFIHFEDLSLDFNFSGPDAQHVAEVFGIPGIDPRPFQLSGDLKAARNRLVFSGARLRVGDNSLGLDGWLDTSGTVPDGDVTVAASGPDFSNIGLVAGLKGAPAAAFDIHGRVRKAGDAWQVDGVLAQIGRNRFTADGAIDASSGPDREISIHLSGDDLSILQPMTGLDGLPPEPFEVTAHIQPDPLGIRLADARGSVGDNRLRAAGVIATAGDFTGTDLEVHAAGPDLARLAALSDVPYLPAGPFDVGGRLSVSRQGLLLGVLQRLAGESFVAGGRLSRRGSRLEMRDVRASLGNLTIRGEGQVQGTAVRATLDAAAPDTTILQRLTGREGLTEGAFSAQATIGWSATDVRLGDASVRAGDYSMSADGTLSLAPLQNRSDLRFSASGPDLRRLLRAPNPAAPPTRPFSLKGAVNGTPSGFSVEGLVASIGDNRIDARFDVDLQAKPRVKGTVSSRFVDLTRLMASGDTQAAPGGADERRFLFPDTPLPMDLLQSADIELSLRTDRLVTPTADMLDLDVGLRLEHGVLQIEPITFHGTGEGRVAGSLHAEPAADGLAVSAAMEVDNVRLGLLAPDSQERSTIPPFFGRVELSGTGNSLHQIMASSNGRVDIREGGGKLFELMGSRLFGDLILQILHTLNPTYKKQQYVTLECAFYDMQIDDGLLTLQNVAIQSDKLALVALGQARFADESLDLSIRMRPRKGFGASIGGVANSFFKVGGTLREPRLLVDPARSVATTGAAVATGGMSILAKGLWDRMRGEQDICKDVQPPAP